MIFEEGPLRSTRFPCTLRMKIMSQQASAAARYVPSLVSWVRQTMSTNREADDLSSYSKVTGGLYVRATTAVKLFSHRPYDTLAGIEWKQQARDLPRPP